MATKVDIAETSLTARQQIEFWRLAATEGSHVNRVSLQASLEGRNPFPESSIAKAVSSAVEELVTADHKIPPTLPTWFKEWEYPDLNKVGDYKSVFSAESLERWRHDDQKTGVVTGKFLHKHMLEADLIKGSLSLWELEEIQKKGIAYFRKHFKGLAVFAWASVAADVDGGRCVPSLVDDGGGVILKWRWLGSSWSASNPALRFAS